MFLENNAVLLNSTALPGTRSIQRTVRVHAWPQRGAGVEDEGMRDEVGGRRGNENDGDRCRGDKNPNKSLSCPRHQSQHSVHQNNAEKPGQTLEVAVYLPTVL